VARDDVDVLAMTRKNLITFTSLLARYLERIGCGVSRAMGYLPILLMGGASLAGAADLRLPENEIVVSGAVSIERSAGQLTITQTTDKGIINWGSFDIGADAKVNFLQPNSSSSTLNRISSGLSTSILGQLTANGKIFVLNSGGVLVGGGARVNVGSLVMSTLQIADQDFLSDQYVLARGEHDGGITNEGSIVGDQVALVSPRILNRGTIDAKSDVVFASGDLVELSITNNNTIVLRMHASAVDSLIDNQGSINAGRVTFKANAMQAIVDSTINLPRSANTIVSENGVLTLVESSGTVIAQQIDLDAGERGGVRVSGILNGSNAAGDGGKIIVTGEEVSVAGSAVISANGFTGGGVVLLGGDWQGQGNTREATFTTIESGAELSANATHTGDGGTIVAWSDVANENSVTKAQGQFAVIGGEEQGSGGRVETSGHRLVLDEVAVNATAPNGKTGQWLIDPVDFTIAASGGDITGTTLGTNLSSADVTILSSSGASGSDGDINVNDAVSWSANTLTLNASGDININSNLLGSGSAKLALLYGQGAVSSGNTSDYTIAKTDAGFSAKVDLPDGANFSTKLGSDGSTVSYTVISSLYFTAQATAVRCKRFFPNLVPLQVSTHNAARPRPPEQARRFRSLRP
jgi:fibronectin-binding autotransporter adhesin